MSRSLLQTQHQHDKSILYALHFVCIKLTAALQHRSACYSDPSLQAAPRKKRPGQLWQPRKWTVREGHHGSFLGQACRRPPTRAPSVLQNWQFQKMTGRIVVWFASNRSNFPLKTRRNSGREFRGSQIVEI